MSTGFHWATVCLLLCWDGAYLSILVSFFFNAGVISISCPSHIGSALAVSVVIVSSSISSIVLAFPVLSLPRAKMLVVFSFHVWSLPGPWWKLPLFLQLCLSLSIDLILVSIHLLWRPCNSSMLLLCVGPVRVFASVKVPILGLLHCCIVLVPSWIFYSSFRPFFVSLEVIFLVPY